MQNIYQNTNLWSPKISSAYKVTLDWRMAENEYGALLGYYAASSGNFLPTFRDNLSVPFAGFKSPRRFLSPEDGTDRLSRNVSKKLPLLAA